MELFFGFAESGHAALDMISEDEWEMM